MPFFNKTQAHYNTNEALFFFTSNLKKIFSFCMVNGVATVCFRVLSVSFLYRENSVSY